MTGREVFLTYLGGPDVERLALSDDEILAAVEAAVFPPRVGWHCQD
jgi:hypothetical protein